MTRASEQRVSLMQAVAWPAAAGNVAWAFLSIIAKPNVGASAPQLAVLALLATYLFADWFYTETVRRNLKAGYYWADAPLAFLIAAFAIGVYEAAPWTVPCLFLVFGVAIVAHMAGAWEPADRTFTRSFERKLLLLAPSLIGVLLLVFGVGVKMIPFWGSSPEPTKVVNRFYLALVMFVVVTSWLVIRFRVMTWKRLTEEVASVEAVS